MTHETRKRSIKIKVLSKGGIKYLTIEGIVSVDDATLSEHDLCAMLFALEFKANSLNTSGVELPFMRVHIEMKD